MENPISLRTLSYSDLDKLFEWRNDPEIMSRTRQYRMLTWEEHERWFENLDPDKNLMYAINHFYVKGGYWYIIGVCGLCHVDWANRSAEVSIYIGDVDCYRKGIGKWVIGELKKIAFDQLNLHRIYAEIYGFNTDGMSFFEYCGFNLDGTLLDTVFRNGQYHNSHFYRFLRYDYEDEKSSS